MMRGVFRMSRGMRLLILATAVFAGANATLAADTAAQQRDEALPEVTVTARHFQLEQRVGKFVYRIATLENAEGIARWRNSVCPSIAGLEPSQGDFIRARVAEIAHAAGVPVGGDKCRPNLFIIVTSDPVTFFDGMTWRTRRLMFGPAHPKVVDDFIALARPVKSWHRTYEADPEGRPVTADGTDWGDLYPILTEGPAVVAAETAYARLNVTWNFRRVLIIVNARQTQGISIGQLADYSAMIGLADIKPGATLGDAPTILKLFDGGPEAAPDGMSEWDQAYLKSLYSTSQTAKGQREQIAHTIIRQIAH
jgi:hypothetical protein